MVVSLVLVWQPDYWVSMLGLRNWFSLAPDVLGGSVLPWTFGVGSVSLQVG